MGFLNGPKDIGDLEEEKERVEKMEKEFDEPLKGIDE